MDKTSSGAKIHNLSDKIESSREGADEYVVKGKPRCPCYLMARWASWLLRKRVFLYFLDNLHAFLDRGFVHRDQMMVPLGQGFLQS